MSKWAPQNDLLLGDDGVYHPGSPGTGSASVLHMTDEERAEAAGRERPPFGFQPSPKPKRRRKASASGRA